MVKYSYHTYQKNGKTGGYFYGSRRLKDATV